MFTCRICGVLYTTKDRLLRHVRDRHPKKLLGWRWCTYKVGSSVNYRMHQHEKTKHQHQYKAAEERKSMGQRTREIPTLVIPASLVRTPLVQEFKSSTPNGTMTPLRSPVPITLGIEQHEELSPVKRDLLELFGARPRKVVSSRWHGVRTNRILDARPNMQGYYRYERTANEASKETVNSESGSSDSNSEVESESHSEVDIIEEKKKVECVDEEIQTKRISVTDRMDQCDIIRIMPMDNC